MDFEAKLKRMDEIVKLLQSQDTALEKSVSLYEEGMKLSKEVEKELSKLERRVEIVTSPASDGDEIITEEYQQ